MAGAPSPLGRIRRPVDFQRVLATPPKARSPHFAVHYLRGAPAVTFSKPPAAELSTGAAPDGGQPVDESAATTVSTPVSSPSGRWFGLVVPKRHARRAVTRTMLKRQMRQALSTAADGLPEGLWVLRLRAPIDPRRYVSADSEALRTVVRGELASMLQHARRR